MSPLVLIINGVTKDDWLEAFLFAMSIAVGLTPEMLPMIVTSTLAKGAVILSRHKVIVKRLDAIQNFGAMDVLCTDKTGTLTQDKIFLARHTDIWGEESDDVLEAAYLNSYYQTGLKNLLDVAGCWSMPKCTANWTRPAISARSMKFPSTSSAGGCRSSWLSTTRITCSSAKAPSRKS